MSDQHLQTVSVEQAAFLLGMNHFWVLALINAKQLDATWNSQTNWRIRLGSLERFPHWLARSAERQAAQETQEAEAQNTTTNQGGGA